MEKSTTDDVRQMTSSDGLAKTRNKEAVHSPIQVYMENARDSGIGGFTIPLPTTREMLAPWIAAISENIDGPQDIVIREVRSSVPELEVVLQKLSEDEIVFDELNYLAGKVGQLGEWETKLYIAALEAGNHNNSVKELINLAENICRFDLQPAFDEAQYGEFLIQMGKDNTATAFEQLETSNDPEERELAEYILRLEAHVDLKGFGRGVAREENGVFTHYGYIVERGEFVETYHGQEAIPLKYRIFVSAIREMEKQISGERHVIPSGLRSDDMLGRYLYENGMLSDEDMQAANARLRYTAYPTDCYRLIGKRRRETENGFFGKDGYVENSSVPDQDTEARKDHKGKNSAIRRGKKNKTRRPER